MKTTPKVVSSGQVVQTKIQDEGLYLAAVLHVVDLGFSCGALKHWSMSSHFHEIQGEDMHKLASHVVDSVRSLGARARDRWIEFWGEFGEQFG